MNNRTPSVCAFCQAKDNSSIVTAREMYFGTRDTFVYLECNNCHALQIQQIPADLGKYYPPDYYSRQTSARKTPSAFEMSIRRKRTQAWLGRADGFGRLLATLSKRKPEYIAWLTGLGIDTDSRILDVGCGAGQLLLKMQRDGFTRLRGLDPFNAARIDHGQGLVIHNHSLDAESDKFDLIMFHHSFEHMPSPFETLQRSSSLLNDNGYLLIRTPLSGSYAWRKYREYWGALDAPRHLNIPSPRAMEYLANRCNLSVERIFFDSDTSQFAISEAYLRDIPLVSIANRCAWYGPDSEENRKATMQFANLLNAVGDGDSGGFLLCKTTAAHEKL